MVHTMLGSPTVVGSWVTVGRRAVLHGCTVEDHCLIGMGAILLNNVKVGEGSIIAAGALVPENTVVPARSLYMGVPAQFKRQLTDAERRFIDGHASRLPGVQRSLSVREERSGDWRLKAAGFLRLAISRLRGQQWPRQ